jgi:hypothetical protein
MSEMPAATATAPVQEKGWMGRNWPWACGCGCLGLLLAGIALAVVIVVAVFGVLRSSDVYVDSLARAQADPAVIEALGEPIEAAYFFAGNVNVSGAGGTADMTIPISGPRGEGTLYIVANKFQGEWQYTTQEVQIAASGERIDLRD